MNTSFYNRYRWNLNLNLHSLVRLDFGYGVVANFYINWYVDHLVYMKVNCTR